MAQSKRIQVLLRPHLTEAVERLAEQESETLSRMTAILVTEALTARGLNPRLTTYLPDELEDSIRRETTASERGWKPSHGKEVLEELTPEWSEPDANTAPSSDQVQLQKLKLMQELMDQLKSM